MPTDTPPGAVPPVPGRRDLILQLLRTSPEPRSIASMADELAVHPNTIRYHLDALGRAARHPEHRHGLHDRVLRAGAGGHPVGKGRGRHGTLHRRSDVGRAQEGLREGMSEVGGRIFTRPLRSG